MSNIAFEMDCVSKKFKKGEIYDSLRDLIPAFASILFKKNRNYLKANEFWALQDISFQVKKGEALGIIGSNGAGKSTILKLLCGIMKPTTGTMEVNGKLSALIEVGAGFHPDLTGRENIYLNGTILGMKRREIDKKFDEIVEFSGIREFIDTPVKRYSSGMFARLGFSVAAHVDPEILIVDEVLSVGDFAFQKKCIEKMKSVFKSGASLIFVSHNLTAVADLCQRCILLDHGKMVEDGPSREVTHYYMNPEKEATRAHDDKEAYISRVILAGRNGGGSIFDTGDKAFLEVEVTGKESCERLSVTVRLGDHDHKSVFTTSTEGLNNTTFSLAPGEKRKVIFELNLHLAPGSYQFATAIYRHSDQKLYDLQDPSVMFQVRADTDIRGIANLHPKATIE